IYYGPDKGWKAYIDGVEAPHFRANYILRAMNVPAGDHEIRFVFKPNAYKTGEIISLLFSLLIVAALVYGLYKWLSREEPTSPIAVADLGAGSAVARKSKSKKKA